MTLRQFKEWLAKQLTEYDDKTVWFVDICFPTESSIKIEVVSDGTLTLFDTV